MTMWSNAVHILLPGMGLTLFGIACLQDWALRLVPNRISIAIALVGLLIRVCDGTLGAGLVAAAVIFVVAFFCWRRGWLGGADVKLFAAGALLVPPDSAARFVAVSCLAGGALALSYIFVGHLSPSPKPVRPASRFFRYVRLEQRRLKRRGPLPYTTAIAAGACFVLCGG